MGVSTLLAVAGSLVAIALGIALFRTLSQYRSLATRLQPISDLDQELRTLRATIEAEQKGTFETMSRLREDSAALRKQYEGALARYKELTAAVASLEENLEDLSVGLYKPHFTYTDSDSYKAAIIAVRKEGKQLVRSGMAVTCATTWSVGGSRAEGERMIKQYQSLILRAFNAEADAAIANVDWNNFGVMQERLTSAFAALNKFGTVMQVALRQQYLELRVRELSLVFEAAELRRKERDEQRRQRAAEREEERVQRELRREQDKAAEEEEEYASALEKARRELEASHDAERAEMLERVRSLEVQLATAHDRKERAKAQAELTKVGHVYIISNVGAFGEGVIKIGCTRRLDPRERISELGDASVPFPFDVHALLYSTDAPGLETALHNRFWDKRINWANDRKEFFRITIADVKDALSELSIPAELVSLAEAREYRETLLALSAQRLDAQEAVAQFSSNPFVET